MIGRNRKIIFSYIEQKMRQRFGSWNKCLLSKAGKDVLLKSVAQAMPTYIMSIFLLPDSLCFSLERLMNRCWWGKNNSVDSIHWLSWDKMCIPKKHSGFGFKRLYEFNLALLGKQGWRLLTNPTSLVARIFKARYYQRTIFTETTMEGVRRMVGDSRATNILSHPWLPNHLDLFVHTIPPVVGSFLLVNDLINHGSRSWDTNLVH